VAVAVVRVAKAGVLEIGRQLIGEVQLEAPAQVFQRRDGDVGVVGVDAPVAAYTASTVGRHEVARAHGEARSGRRCADDAVCLTVTRAALMDICRAGGDATADGHVRISRGPREGGADGQSDQSFLHNSSVHAVSSKVILVTCSDASCHGRSPRGPTRLAPRRCEKARPVCLGPAQGINYCRSESQEGRSFCLVSATALSRQQVCFADPQRYKQVFVLGMQVSGNTYCKSYQPLVCFAYRRVERGVEQPMEFRKAADGRAYVVKGFNVSAFFEVVAEVVAARGVNWKVVAKEIGVSPSTLSRRGRGRCPDSASLAALSAWAGVNPADFVVMPEKDAANPLAAISGVLRSDPDLGPDAVRALEAILRVADASFERTKHETAAGGAAGSPDRVAPSTSGQRFDPQAASPTKVGHRDDAIYKLESSKAGTGMDRQAA
jgi:hypothetical protein